MDDLGKVLYETHVETVCNIDPSRYMWVKKWNELEKKTQDAWRKTAQDFMSRIFD